MAVRTRWRRFVAGIVATASLMVCHMLSDIVKCINSSSSLSIKSSGLAANESQAERSMDVPLGRFGCAAGMVEKMTRLTKFARRIEVKEENKTNCGPRTFSPGTLALGG